MLPFSSLFSFRPEPSLESRACSTLFLQVPFVAAYLLGTVALSQASPQTPPQASAFEPDPPSIDLTLEPVTQALRLPVYATPLGDGSGRLYIVGLEGLIRIFEDGELLERPFLDLRDYVTGLEGEQGLYSLAFHPDFAENRRFFVAYTERETGHLLVVEYRAQDEFYADPETFERVLVEMVPPEPYHHGGSLVFGPDGYLYVGIGDGTLDQKYLRQRPLPPQDLSSLRGKILRLDVDTGVDPEDESGVPYTIPPDNPFVGLSYARGEVYAFGFRNPWKLTFDPLTGGLYAPDVGWVSFEEINRVVKGGNYGWPITEGFGCTTFPEDGSLVVEGCEVDDYLLPLVSYGHLNLDAAGGNAVLGGYMYRGEAHPELYGRYLFADFTNGRIWSLHQEDGVWVTEALLDTDFNPSSFVRDEQGELYLLDVNGGLYGIGVQEQRQDEPAEPEQKPEPSIEPIDLRAE